MTNNQTVKWYDDGNFRISRYNVILNKYSNRFSTFTDNNIPHSWGKTSTRQILSTTAFDFTYNGASFGLSLKVKQRDVQKFKFSVQLLNETVLYNLKVQCLALNIAVTDYYAQYGQLNCTVLNQGQGYRSQNYSISIQKNRPYYNYFNENLLATVFLNSFMVFNPQGKYVYLNWKMHLNKTHYTIVFQTDQKNIVTNIEFNLVSTDLFYVKYFYFHRMINIGTFQCPGAQCPGTGGFNPGIFYPGEHRQFWGMSGFNFTKEERINWFLKTTSFSNIASGYIQSAGIQNIQISGFFVAVRRCVNLDPDPNPNRDPLIDPPYIDLPQYFDPATLSCTLDCSSTLNPIAYFSTKVCVKCNYRCLTCTDRYSNKCSSCNTLLNRQFVVDNWGSHCPCINLYVDVGAPMCKKCSDLMEGCLTCDLYNRCLSCQTELQPSADKTKCQCIDSSKFLTRSAQCIDIDGCLNSLNGTAGTKLCIECDLQKNLQLNSFICECLPGYIPDMSQSYLTCIESCGNKIITVTEQCDDGNSVSGDGCDSTCMIEQGYDCFSNYTDASFCILNFAVIKHYETLKILDQENTAEVYFAFQPFFQKYFDHMDIFKSLFNTSSLQTDNDTFTNITYDFFNHENTEIRFKIRFKYLQKVNETTEHYVRFFIRDTNRTHYLTQTLYYTLKSKNYPLYIDHETKDMHDMFSYVLLSGIVVGYLIFFISILSESWLGIQLMHTLQWLFLYFFLFDNMEGCLSSYISILKLSLGYNNITEERSPYVHYEYQDQLLRFGYVKQFFLNFNFSALSFGLPVLLILVKILVDWRNESQSLSKKAFTRIKKKQKNKKNKSSLCDWLSNKNLLSFDFIFGRLFLSFVMVNLFQVFLSFYIQISPWFVLDDRLNNTLFSLYMYVIVLVEVSLCAWIYIESWQRLTYDSESVDPTYRRIFKFQGFKYTYPLVYIFIQLMKIIYFVLSFEQQNCLYVMIGCDGFLLLFYIIYRPYTKPQVQDKQQQSRGYFIHNLHNIWNCMGLTGFLVLVYFTNKKKEDEVQQFSQIIIYCVIGVFQMSLMFALMRMLHIAGAFDNCLNFIDKKQNSNTESKQKPLQQLKIYKAKIEKNSLKKIENRLTSDYQSNIKKNQKNYDQIPQKSKILQQLKNRYKRNFLSNLNQEQLTSLKKSRSSRTTYKKK